MEPLIHAFFILVISICLYLAIVLFVGERKYQKNMLAKFDPIDGVKKEIKGFKECVEHYREQHIQNVEALSNVHEQLSRVTGQMMILKKNQRILRENMIRRYEILLPDDFRKDIKKLAKQAENF